MPGITVTQACKSYETSHYTVKAVNHANLSVESGEAVAIVGPSGSGAVGGEEVLNMSDRRCSAFRNASFGYIVQDFALLDDETVYHNIRIPLLYNRQIKRREHKPRIREIAQKLDISDKLNRKAGKLSGGERQRVAIARAIVCDQPIILADEPTGSLDAANKANVMDILMRLCKESGKTLIIVTHDPSIAERCDRIVQMADGCIEGNVKPTL